MREGVALGMHLPAAVDKGMGALCRADGVHHDGEVAPRGIFHTNRDIESACGQAVLLVFHGACANGGVGQQVVEQAVIFGVQHFVGTAEARFRQGSDMQLTNGNQTCQHIGACVRVGLVEHSLVALPRGTGLIGVDAGDNQKLLLHLVLQGAQAVNVLHDRLLAVGRAGSDHQNQAVTLALKNVGNLSIPLFLCEGGGRANRIFCLDIHRDGKLA